MTITIDSAGRLVIPKSIRESAHITPGMPLSIQVRDGRIEIEPVPLAVRVENRGGVGVLVPAGEEPPPLTVEGVREAQERIRRDRP
jgi:AbrB family looped-hinge helix DNA binding protein